MYHILMVCTGNICRSPMAVGLTRFLLPAQLKPHVQVDSAGCAALHGNPAQPNAVAVMARLGIDISDHRARQVSGDLIKKMDLVVTMEALQRDLVRRMLLFKKNKVRLLTEFCLLSSDQDIADPYGGPLEAYQACVDAMLPCLRQMIQWLETLKIEDALVT